MATARWRSALRIWRRGGQESGLAAGLVEQSRRLSSSNSESITNKKLVGKTAIITGAASGFGAAFAKLFAAHGAEVIITDIADERGKEVAREIGPQALFRHCDVGKEDDIAGTVDFAVEKFGRLDIMCNNAGFITGLDKFETLDLVSGYDQPTSILVRGVLAGIKHAARVMIPAEQGVILNTASVASVACSASIPIVYNMAKRTIPGMTIVAAGQLGQHGIRVNTISPHAVITPLFLNLFEGTSTTKEISEKHLHKESFLKGRICSEQDVANAALFLCSDDSGYITGQNLVIDGGYSNQTTPSNVFGDAF